jgi:FkbH-like protein
MYREQMTRTTEQEKFVGGYVNFLRHCCIRLEIRPLEDRTLKRVYELSQRTNQMNFSGNRYKRMDVERLLFDPRYRTYVLSCTDRFGSYGIVGFSIFDTSVSAVTDLMFSCRVQAKHVEHAFLAYLIRRHRAEIPSEDFTVIYRPTERNAPSARVFEDLRFTRAGETEDNRVSFVYATDRKVPVVDEIEIDASALKPLGVDAALNGAM